MATAQNVEARFIANQVLARFVRATQDEDNNEDEWEDRGIGFEIVGEIRDELEIASGAKVKARSWLNSTYGQGNWRKMKGTAMVSYNTGETETVEVHWYEARGIGRVDIKIKKW